MEKGPTPIPFNSEFRGGSAEKARRIILRLEKMRLGIMGFIPKKEEAFFGMLKKAAEAIRAAPTGVITSVYKNNTEPARKVEIQGTIPGNDGIICISSNSKKQLINIFYNEALPNISLILASPDNTKSGVFYYKVAQRGEGKFAPVDEKTNQQIEELLQAISENIPPPK